MMVKRNSINNRKEGEITRLEVISITQQAELTLKKIKEKTGDVVLVTINDRTTIELPAHLSPEERATRVENYIKLHKSKI